MSINLKNSPRAAANAAITPRTNSGKTSSPTRCSKNNNPVHKAMSTQPNHDARSTSASPGWFKTTHWSDIIAVGNVDSPLTVRALERLCASYWPPLYGFARRRGAGPEDAKDLTQSFFVRLLEKISGAGPIPSGDGFAISC